MRIRPVLRRHLAAALAAAVVLGAGACGGPDRGPEAPRAGSRSSPPRWHLTEVPVGQICGAPVSALGRILGTARTGELPARLADHVPDSVPVQGWRRLEGVSYAPDTPGEQVAGAIGWSRGYSSTFNDPNRPGGFVVYVLEYRSADEAIDDAASYHQQLVCDQGLDAYTVKQQEGILVSRGAELFVATWVHANRRVDVRSQFFTDPKVEAERALIAVQATWDAS